MRTLTLLVALCAVACGIPKPPLVRPHSTECDAACAHVEALACGTSFALCQRFCDDVAKNDRDYVGCLSAAPTCKALNACDVP